MAKLYEVTVEYTIYVVAEDEFEAELEAKSHVQDEEPQHLDANEIENEKRIDGQWRGSIPYGAEGDETCVQAFERLRS